MAYLNLKPIDLKDVSVKVRERVNFVGRLMLPKYDGCFCIFLFENGKCVRVMSRDNKDVTSLPHIADDLWRAFPWIINAGRVAILGEAWTPGLPFEEVSGAFRRKAPQPSLGFAPFDAVQWGGEAARPGLFSENCYSDRLALIGPLQRRAGPFLIHSTMPVECEDGDHAMRYAKHLKAMGGYDGCIVSDPYATYTPGSGSQAEFIKIKPLLSFSLEVVGVEKDVGEKTGRATCALVVRFKNTTCKVATGLSQAQQANPEQFIGKIIEVACMAVYPGEFGLMREPRYLGTRDDVTQADY